MSVLIDVSFNNGDLPECIKVYVEDDISYFTVTDSRFCVEVSFSEEELEKIKSLHKEAKTSRVVSVEPFDWIEVDGNYAAKAKIHCPYCCDEEKTCVIGVESHNSEPCATKGTFYCNACSVKGVSEPVENDDHIVGDTGIAIACEWMLKSEV
jgi:hypothetical protein